MGQALHPLVVPLRTLAEVIDHLGSSGQTGIIDGTEIRVRRPAAGRKDRDRFVSGKNKQNAAKAVLTNTEGRMLFCSPAQPASCADIIRVEHGIAISRTGEHSPATSAAASI